MTNAENDHKQPLKKIELEDMAPGIRGRSIPPEELEVTDAQVRKLAEGAGSEVFASFIYRLYKVKPLKKNG